MCESVTTGPIGNMRNDQVMSSHSLSNNLGRASTFNWVAGRIVNYLGIEADLGAVKSKPKPKIVAGLTLI